MQCKMVCSTLGLTTKFVELSALARVFKRGFDQIFPVGALLYPSQIQLEGLGSAVSSPSGSEAPDAHEFGAFQTKKEAFGAIVVISPLLARTCPGGRVVPWCPKVKDLTITVLTLNLILHR